MNFWGAPFPKLPGHAIPEQTRFHHAAGMLSYINDILLISSYECPRSSGISKRESSDTSKEITSSNSLGSGRLNLIK